MHLVKAIEREAKSLTEIDQMAVASQIQWVMNTAANCLVGIRDTVGKMAAKGGDDE
jgi:hypothetical protein